MQEQVDKIGNLRVFASLGLAIFALSWIPIFFRFLEAEIGPFAAAFNRVWLVTILLGLWNGLQYIKEQFSSDKSCKHNPYTPLVWLQLLVAGISLAGHLLLLAWSLSQISITNTCLLANMTPIWTVLLGWLIWSQKFDNLFLIGMGVAIAGASIIGIEDWKLATASLKADGVAIVASIFYSIYLLSVEYLRSHLSFVTILGWISTISTISILPLALIAENQLFPHSWSGWTFVILLGLICQLLGQGLVMYCLKNLSSGLLSMSKLLVPIINGFLAWVLFAEVLSFWNYVAFCLVLLGIYIAKSSSFAVKE
ncbi:DMT family transporter [Dapis sp. BLCC M229]|uniref:DMT family transporter n=1 Tax=Dapis sp. BLCC M229 TaxID=3400188 RepID=UPI003CF083A1